MNSEKRSMRLVTRIGISVVIALGLMVPLTASAQVTTSNANNSGIDNFQHIFVIMMENTSYTSLIGNPNAPFINSTAKNYGLAKSYFGVTHPSQPNYIAATSGSTQGVTGDANVDLPATVQNIADQIESSGRTWKAYMQSYSLCSLPTDTSCGNQLYERKHNPFISYLDIQTNAARVANIVDFSQFSTDLANNTVPNFSWISPDQCHDMHGRGAPSTDPCNFGNVQGLIATGDAFLKSTVKAITNSQTWQNSNSAIFITWDESDFPFADVSGCCDAVPGGGHVVTLVLLSENETARTSKVAYNHYSMLLTIESAWKLGCLGFTCDTKNVTPMTDLVNQNG